MNQVKFSEDCAAAIAEVSFGDFESGGVSAAVESVHFGFEQVDADVFVKDGGGSGNRYSFGDHGLAQDEACAVQAGFDGVFGESQRGCDIEHIDTQDFFHEERHAQMFWQV